MTAGSRASPILEDLLVRVPLFAEVDRLALAQLAAHLDPIVLEEGETVCRQGEPGDCLFVLTAGRLASTSRTRTAASPDGSTASAPGTSSARWRS